MKNNNKLYQYIIVGLVCLNIFLVAFFLLNRPRLPEPKNDRVITPPHHILDLSEEQEESFHALVAKHKNESKSINKEQRKLIRILLLENMDRDEREKVEIDIQSLEIRKINSLSSHFEEIKNILTKEQLENINPFKKQIVNKILSPRTRDRGPKHLEQQRGGRKIKEKK